MLLSVLKEWRAMPAGGPSLPWLLLGLSVLALGGQMSRAQTVAPSDQKVGTPAAPVVISLQEALKRAQANEPNFAASLANARIAGLDKSIARAGLLPAVTYHNQALYTQPGGQGQGIGANTFKFIGNNAVHEYASQAMVNEDIGLGQIAAVRRADAAAAVASAELEIARRGLVAAVVGIYYGLSSADRKRGIAEQAADEAAAFVKLTSQREQAREAAHADTIKAQLQQQQRERELEDAKLNADKARLELGVLLFADPRTPYTINISAAPAALTSR